MKPTPRFLAFMPFIFQWEGGYDNDPDDPGGETKYGIDKRSHPKENIKALTKQRAQEIYFEEYWQKARCEDLPTGVGEVVMNIAVNCGHVRAGKWLQQAVEMPPEMVDGSIGSKTVYFACVSPLNHDRLVLPTKLIQRTEAHYRSIARGSLAKFLRGWLNRNKALASWVYILLSR